jgi:predicted helicase
VPLDERLLGEYERGWKVTDVFPINVLGVQTHRDDFAFDFEEERIRQRIIDLRNNAHSNEELREMYGLSDNRDWQLSVARKRLQGDAKWEQYFAKCLYRPFDWRFCYFSTTIMDYPRRQLIDNVFRRENICLLVSRQTTTNQWRHVSVSRDVAESCVVSTTTKEQNYDLPLYLYPAEGGMQLGKGRSPNLNPKFVNAISEKLGLGFVEDGKGDLVKTLGPEDIFNYSYAVLHSPTYRSRYAGFLKIDFPRLPLTSDKKLLKALAEKGAELVALHLVESPILNNLITKYPVSGSNTVEKVSYDENNKRVYINKQQYFEGIPSEVWNFHIGGYQVCQKWLKDRKGRTLSYDDLHHYQRIVVAIKETIRLMSEIDSIIPSWPIQ